SPLFSGNVRLVKTANSPSVYAIVGNQKHLIRNEEVFYSYDYNFKNVKIISEAELNRYKLARLVKERGSTKVYYLSHEKNLKKYHNSLQAFNAYSNNNWGDVIEISSTDLNSWEEAVLFKEAGDSTVYFITADYKKAAIPSESEFINAGFQWDKILTLYKGDIDSYQTVDYNISLVQARERIQASQPSDSGASQNNNVDSLAQLIISLDSSSPEAGLIPYSTSGNIVAVFKAQAVNANITIESINITKSGILSADKVNSLIIEDENGVEFGRTAPISGNTTNIRFENNSLVVPQNSTKKLILKAGFNSGNELNHDVDFGIKEEMDIKCNGSISGVFPMYGEKQKLIAASNFVGQIEVKSDLINAAVRSVNIGSKQEQISKFIFTEKTGNEKVAIKKIILTSNGSASDQAVDNITLYKDGKVLKNAGKMQNRTMTIDLSGNNIEVEKDKSAEVTIKADILREEGSTLKFVIDKASDISAVGLSEGYGIIVSSPESFPIGRGASDGYNKVTFGRQNIGFFAVSIDEDDLKIYRGQDGSILGKFEMRNTNEDIYLQRIQLKINKTGGAPDLDENFKIRNETDNSDIITLADEKVAAGAIGDFSLSNYKIGANRTVSLTIRINVPEDSASGNTYQVSVQGLSYKIGLDNTEYFHGSSVSGQVMAVYAPRLVISADALSNDSVGIAGEDDIDLASFDFTESTSDERIKITSLVASLTTASDDLSYVSGFSNLALYAGGRRVSQLISEPSSSTYTFTNLSISISAGASSNITIKADAADYAEGTIQFKIDAVTAEGYSSKAPVYIMGEGTISDSVTILPPSE
ncbi:MAG: hypothetical protein WC323_04660, partial [Patescibacteria group bacterium]